MTHRHEEELSFPLAHTAQGNSGTNYSTTRNAGDHRARVLVVDDDPAMRWLIALRLRREGYEVIEAASGDQALAYAIDDVPSLILLDIMMPGRDGFDTCRLLREDERTRQVPVIFISARNDPGNRTEVSQLGADDYLVKPLDLKVLTWRIRAAIQRHGIRLLFGTAPQSA